MIFNLPIETRANKCRSTMRTAILLWLHVLDDITKKILPMKFTIKSQKVNHQNSIGLPIVPKSPSYTVSENSYFQEKYIIEEKLKLISQGTP